jgi:lipid-binding SYLF domain-containing protein
MRNRIIMTALGAAFFGTMSLAVLPAMAQPTSSDKPVPSSSPDSNLVSGAGPQVLAGATQALKAMRSDPHYNDLVARCRGMLIVPQMAKDGIGEHGQAVLIKNTPQGWSPPAFLTLRRMSPGPQASGPAGATIMLLMTSKAMDDFSDPEGISVGPNAELGVIDYSGQATVPVNGGDVIVWSKQGDADPQTSFHATDISANRQQDRRFYGKAITTAQILNGDVTQRSAADGLAGVLTP